MKKLIFLLMILLNLPVLSIGQQNGFTLSGKVTDCRTHAGIDNTIVKLVCSDGRSISTQTDTSGYYFFDSIVVKKGKRYVVSESATNESNTARNKIRGNYLSSSEKYAFNTYDSVSGNKNIEKDFCMVPNECTLFKFPVFRFPKNNTTDYTITDSYYDLPTFAMFLDDSRSFIIELRSYTSADEKNPQLLAIKRAEYIKAQLIKLGVEEGRIRILACENQEPLISDAEIAKMKTSKEKEVAYQKNRRITVGIVSNDFQSKKAVIPAKAYNPDGE